MTETTGIDLFQFCWIQTAIRFPPSVQFIIRKTDSIGIITKNIGDSDSRLDFKGKQASFGTTYNP